MSRAGASSSTWNPCAAAGLGPLFERFLRLKEKLEKEGLFDPDAKRPLPEYPRQIGILTRWPQPPCATSSPASEGAIRRSR
jgi:exonuclease VII large subunit